MWPTRLQLLVYFCAGGGQRGRGSRQCQSLATRVGMLQVVRCIAEQIFLARNERGSKEEESTKQSRKLATGLEGFFLVCILAT